MKLYPESAAVQLEFDKIKALLLEKCRLEYSKAKAADLRIHTQKDYIERELKQSHEFKQLLQNSIYFPNDYVLNLAKELKLTDGNPEKVMQPEDFAELIVMQLKLNRRVFVKEAGLWSTNP
ncbi:MAG: hypothetical protein ACO1NX_06105 [Chitinophagaceae bacterium]